MAKGKKTVVDKWKVKKWFEIVAPKMFENKVIGETMANDENVLVNRIVSIDLPVLTRAQIQSAMFTKVHFRITEVKGQHAYTKYIGHQIANSYLRTIARRSRTVLDVVVDGNTKDNEGVRLKMIAITGSKVSENTRKNLWKAAKEVVAGYITTHMLDELILDSLQGKVSGKVFNRLKEITAMRKVDTKKMERNEVFK